MMRILISMLSIVVVGIACAAPPSLDKRPNEKYVSLIQLLANPDTFNGEYVNVSGYLVLRDEYESSLYFDENSFRSGMSANSVAIDLEDGKPEIRKLAQERDRRYVIVSGRFTAASTVFSLGKLQEIYYLAPAPTEQ